jgi:DNA polymerase-4
MELYKSLYQRRLLVRLIGVKFSHLVSGGHQINLFEDHDKILNLYQAMDKMRERYGDRAVIRAVGMEAKSIKKVESF